MTTPPFIDQQTLTRLLGASISTHMKPDGSITPVALLGLSAAFSTPAQIESSLQRQLDRLHQHSESETPEADQLRIILHEAAEWLLKDKVQTTPIALEPRPPDESAPPAPPRHSRPSAPIAHPPMPTRETVGDPIVARTLVIVAAFLVFMVVVAVVGTMFMSGRGSAATANTASNSPASPIGAQPLSGASSTQASSSATPSTQLERAGTISASATPIDHSKPRVRSEFVDPALVIRELRAAAETAKIDPEKALNDFERAFIIAGDWWCRFDNSQVRAAGDAVVEFIYRMASRRERSDRVLAIINAPAAAIHSASPMRPDEVWPAVWSAGVLARLYRERDLPAGLATQIARSIDAALGEARPPRSADATFDNGAAAAFRALPSAILAGKPLGLGVPIDSGRSSSSLALARWIEGVTLFTREGEVERERYLIGALALVLTAAPEPEADSRVFEAINMLVSETKWRAGGPARPTLLEWFRDPRVSVSDLRVLTSALATRSGAEGVDSTMALSMTAKPEERARLRDQYASVWGLAEASARADAAHEWITAAQSSLAVTAPSNDAAAQIALAAALAKLTTSAAIIWRGAAPSEPVFFEAPSGAIVDPTAPATTSNAVTVYTITGSGQSVSGATGNGQDGAWTREYLAERRSIPGREKRLEEVSERGRPIGPIDAGLLAQAACSESPWKIRELAQRIAIGLSDEPALVGAMLDFLPLAPRTSDVGRLYSEITGVTLPPPGDNRWELEARRAILSKLMSMLTSSGVHGEIERSTATIAEAYLAAVNRTLDEGRPDAVADGAVEGITELANQIHQDAASSPVGSAALSLEAIDRRREQHRLQAVGPVQSFTAEQSGLVDLLGFIVSAERPVEEPAIIAILSETAMRRRRSKHVFEQVLANERALVKLWLARFGAEVKP